MAQPDAYIRISTLNDTTQAQRSTEQLGDTLRDALDPDSAEAITEAIGALAAALRGIDTDGVDGVRDGLDGVGNNGGRPYQSKSDLRCCYERIEAGRRGY